MDVYDRYGISVGKVWGDGDVWKKGISVGKVWENGDVWNENGISVGNASISSSDDIHLAGGTALLLLLNGLEL